MGDGVGHGQAMSCVRSTLTHYTNDRPAQADLFQTSSPKKTPTVAVDDLVGFDETGGSSVSLYVRHCVF